MQQQQQHEPVDDFVWIQRGFQLLRDFAENDHVHVHDLDRMAQQAGLWMRRSPEPTVVGNKVPTQD